MEKKTIGLLFIIVVLLLFSGCSNGKQAKIKTIDHVDTGVLRKSAGTYVGDASKDMEIIRHLAGGETLKTIDLTGQSMKIIYGHKEGGVFSEEEINEYWFNGDRALKNFYFNGIYLTAACSQCKGLQLSGK
ncbi:hypothetical protein QUF84_23365 [Fictibacillus enclensis]|uniref:hypothetical protein n=1 Tax=Fictibacillus enclensis TaxID=1017270 RepID=UPI0025A2E9BB|nr:hypothetical protein [Fictibacillus enclensis]MDM5340144.1 hypothetical protein [Fictibacillus enclensis]